MLDENLRVAKKEKIIKQLIFVLTRATLETCQSIGDCTLRFSLRCTIGAQLFCPGNDVTREHSISCILIGIIKLVYRIYLQILD